MHGLADERVQLDRLLRAGRRDPAHDLGGLADIPETVAGIDPLGAEGEMAVLPDATAAPLQQWHEHLARGAGPGRRLEDEQGAVSEVVHGRGRAHEHVAEIGVAVRPEGGGQADEDGVPIRQGGGVLRGAEASGRHEGREVTRRDVLDVGTALADGGDLGRVGVDSDDVRAGFGEGGRQRQTDIAEADAPDPGAGRRLSRHGGGL